MNVVPRGADRSFTHVCTGRQRREALMVKEEGRRGGGRWQRQIFGHDDMCVSTGVASGHQLIFVRIIRRRNLLIRRQFLSGDPTDDPIGALKTAADVPCLCCGRPPSFCFHCMLTLSAAAIHYCIPTSLYTTDLLHESQSSILIVMHYWRILPDFL